eukprot:TRINITY_DN5194_c0_g1_i1.p2 TRINITY_DN5194_c0_g1~~TRINITY_DN5194_c0_g1_i1.p2  ORF type:complete len:113 (-),score=32.81 TRINITY_DN5194_c0_g1_i1:167-505(-)
MSFATKTSLNVSKTALPLKRSSSLAVVLRRPTVVRVENNINSNNKKNFEVALPVGVTCGLAAMMSSPLVAEAAVTPSLKNLLYSVLAGAVVFGAIAGGVSFVSTFDPLDTRK